MNVAVAVDSEQAHVNVAGKFHIDMEILWLAAVLFDELFQVST